MIKNLTEEEVVNRIIDKYSEWIEAYNINPYLIASHVLAKELIKEKQKAEICSYVEHAR